MEKRVSSLFGEEAVRFVRELDMEGEHSIDGAVIHEWSRDKKETACFSDSFTDRLYKDLHSFQRKLRYILESDSRLASAFGQS
jgi:hypothetical protein